MKNIKLFTALILAFIFSLVTQAHAQEVFNKENLMSQGKQNCFALDLEGADKKMAEKKWKEILKDRAKVNRDKKAKEWISIGADIPSFKGSVDLYLKLEQGKEMTRALVFVKSGDQFVQEEDDKAEAVHALLRDYYNLVQREVVEKELKEEEKYLKNLNKDVRNLEKKNKNYHKDIEKYQRKIEDAEADIQENLQEQDLAREAVITQEKYLEKVKKKLNDIGRNN